MLNLKKTAVAVLALGSSAVFAGTMGPVCTANNVTVPCESTGWGVGAQALYLQPTYTGGLAFADVGSNSSSNSAVYGGNDGKWNWGFKIEGQYQFSTGNDLNVNWYHLGGQNRNQTVTSTSPSVLTTNITDNVTVKPKWDAVNVEFGQHVDFGEFKKIRFHGGVQFARITTDVTQSGTGTFIGDVNTSSSFYGSNNLKYNGFGPRIGADYSYQLGNGLAMYANGATSLLAGTGKFSRSFNASNATAAADLAAAGVLASSNGSRTAIVPELEAKLGLTYSYALAQGDLTLDVGYMWMNYFNVLPYVSNYNLVASDSDFGLQGPYIGLKWVGTVV